MMQKSNNSNYDAMSDPALVIEICKGFKQMRLNKNMSQEELAFRAGVNRTTVARFENGQSGTLITMVQLLRGLNKLDIITAFSEEPQISPLKILKLQESRRRKASPKKKPLSNGETK